MHEKYDAEKARLDEMASGREGESIDLTLGCLSCAVGKPASAQCGFPRAFTVLVSAGLLKG
ncbi:MAG: hypothetical protein WD077_02915 [Bacteroidia bacterium]